MKAFSVSLTLCTFLILSDAYWFDPNSPNFKLGGLCEQMRNQSQTDTVTDNATFSRRQTAVSIGEFVPQCDGNGNFLPQQCSGSTGYCWCVNVITGKEIPNTKTPPGVTPVQCGLCEQERNQSQGLIGEFVPQCDANGNFFPQQCWASTGYCWCVNIITGKEIPNTKTRPGVTPVQCGLCKQERKSSQDRPGEFVPQCDANGNFLPQQCWASTGYCWCINIITGKEILNTRTPPGVTPVQCGLCEQQRKHSQDRIGEFVPKCDVNGNFLPQQCSGSTGYCWCVDVITGNEIPNTKTRPGVTPVQCGKNSCPKDWSRIGKRCFIFINSPKTWSEAEGYCLFEGANLASVHSNEENNIIQILTKGDTHKFPLTWIGGNDCIQSGFWMWSDGTKFNYENWSTKVDYNMEDKRRTMHCLEMNYGYRKKWNAASCNDTLPFVCAKEI